MPRTAFVFAAATAAMMYSHRPPAFPSNTQDICTANFLRSPTRVDNAPPFPKIVRAGSTLLAPAEVRQPRYRVEPCLLSANTRYKVQFFTGTWYDSTCFPPHAVFWGFAYPYTYCTAYSKCSILIGRRRTAHCQIMGGIREKQGGLQVTCSHFHFFCRGASCRDAALLGDLHG